LQKVSASGIVIVPPATGAAKTRRPSSGNFPRAEKFERRANGGGDARLDLGGPGRCSAQRRTITMFGGKLAAGATLLLVALEAHARYPRIDR
jgi:hypothetical protein